MKDSNRDNCIICLSDCIIGDEVINLPCSHLFHEDCIIQWLSYKNKCPLCKKSYNYANNNNGNNEDNHFSLSYMPYINEINYIQDNNLNNYISMINSDEGAFYSTNNRPEIAEIRENRENRENREVGINNIIFLEDL